MEYLPVDVKQSAIISIIIINIRTTSMVYL